LFRAIFLYTVQPGTQRDTVIYHAMSLTVLYIYGWFLKNKINIYVGFQLFHSLL